MTIDNFNFIGDINDIVAFSITPIYSVAFKANIEQRAAYLNIGELQKPCFYKAANINSFENYLIVSV